MSWLLTATFYLSLMASSEVTREQSKRCRPSASCVQVMTSQLAWLVRAVTTPVVAHWPSRSLRTRRLPTTIVDIGDAGPLLEQGRVQARIPPQDVAVIVASTRSGYVAFPAACPHLGRCLIDAEITNRGVRCLGHGWRYSLTLSESPLMSEASTGRRLPYYRAKVVDGRMLVEVPAGQ